MGRQKVDETEIELVKELSQYITFYEKPNKQTYDENIKADFATLQIEGVAMLINRLNNFNIALLADEVGMGKTFQALAVMTYFFKEAKSKKKNNFKVLVITPRKEVLNQWKEEEYNEFREKHLLDDKEKDLPENNEENIHEVWNFQNGLLRKNSDIKIVFAKSTSFSTKENMDENRKSNLLNDIKQFDLIVVDEAHKFRNYDNSSKDSKKIKEEDSEIIKTAKMIFKNIKQDAKILLMTATPLHSRIGDFKRVVDLFNIPNKMFKKIQEDNKTVQEVEKELMKNIMVRRLRVMSNGENKYAYRNEITEDISLTAENSKDYKNELFFAMLQKKYVQSENSKDLSKSKYLLDFLEGTRFDKDDVGNNILDEELSDVLNIYRKFYEDDEKPSNNKYEFVLENILKNEEKKLIFVRRTASAYEITRQYINEFDKYAWDMIKKAFGSKNDITMPTNRDSFNAIVKKYFDDDLDKEINKIIEEIPRKDIAKLKTYLLKYKNSGEHYKPTALKKALLEYFKYSSEYDPDKFKEFLQNALIETSDKKEKTTTEFKIPKSKILGFFKRQKDSSDNSGRKYLQSTHAERFLNKFNSSKKTTYTTFFEKDFADILKNKLYTQDKYNLIKSAVLHASVGLVELYCCDIKAAELSKENHISQYNNFKSIVENKIESFQFVKEINDFLEYFDKFEKYLNKTDEENSKDTNFNTGNNADKIKLDSSIFKDAQPAFPYIGSTKNKTVIGRFNSPFFPKILCGTSTLQEGVNLHLFCNKVYHFGAAHTMGDDEQRIGRVDRIMGKMDRELKNIANDAFYPTLDIHYPYLKATFDEFNLKKMLCNKRKTEKLIDRGMDIITEENIICDKGIKELVLKPKRNLKADIKLSK